jgi:4-hydroxybenzoate polyprenyltransferase
MDNKSIYPWSLWILAFFGFCAVSSLTYIINDWVDREEDRIHPTKKDRPLASGKISGKKAIIVSTLLALTVIVIGWQLGTFYSQIVATYFILTNAYSFGLKHIPILDIAMIAENFSLRMLAGIPAWPNVAARPYFILIISTLFIFLTHKRRSDIKLLGEKATQHKKVLKFYTPARAYGVRIIGYGGTLFGLNLLWNQGIPLIYLGPPFGLLVLTSLIFSKKPELTLKPHNLIKNWAWALGLLLTILSWTVG